MYVEYEIRLTLPTFYVESRQSEKRESARNEEIIGDHQLEHLRRIHCGCVPLIFYTVAVPLL